MDNYHPDLPTTDLIFEVRRLLTTRRRVERLICRYLADLADRICERSDRDLALLTNELDAAKAIFGLGTRKTRERIRVGRALRQLPRIEHALIVGDISYSRVREITRVAQPDTESSWLEAAQSVDMRALERQVATATPRPADASAPRGDTSGACVLARDDWKGNDQRAGDDPADLHGDGAGGFRHDVDPRDGAGGFRHDVDPRDGAGGSLNDASATRALSHDACNPAGGGHRDTEKRRHAGARTEWTGRDSVLVTFELSAGAWALLERALEGARRRDNARAEAIACDDGEALAAIARDALSFQNANRGKRGGEADSAEPHCRVMTDEHEPWGESATGTHTGTGPVELPPTLAALGGGAPEIQLESKPRVDALMNGSHALCADSVSPPTQGRSSTTTQGGSSTTTQGGSSTATQGGSSTTTQGGSSATTRLLQIMGRRRGWTIDDLIEQSGLHIAEVQHALLLLQLQDRIHHRGYEIDPIW
jgi:hypothetical protein